MSTDSDVVVIKVYTVSSFSITSAKRIKNIVTSIQIIDSALNPTFNTLLILTSFKITRITKGSVL
jgi:hypothetical protein